MIDTTELRRNNLVTHEWYDSFKIILKVDSINEKGINLEIVDDGNWSEIAQRWIEPEYRSDIIFPIPINEEWISKAGFEKYKKLGGYEGYLKDGWFISNDNYSFMVLGSSVILCKLKWVHQLQNLFFYLASEELVFSSNNA